jgi:hypothetical protein
MIANKEGARKSAPRVNQQKPCSVRITEHSQGIPVRTFVFTGICFTVSFFRTRSRFAKLGVLVTALREGGIQLLYFSGLAQR